VPECPIVGDADVKTPDEHYCTTAVGLYTRRAFDISRHHLRSGKLSIYSSSTWLSVDWERRMGWNSFRYDSLEV